MIVVATATKPSRFLLTFGKAQNSLRLPRRTTSERPKVLRTLHFFVLLAWKCASCRNSVHFFRHLNFQKCSDVGVFCTFWLGDVLRATTACTFSTSQLPKVLRTWSFFRFFNCKCVARHSCVQLFISHLTTGLRTRRFSEPTFRPSGATVFSTLLPFRAPASSFLWLFLFSDLLSSALLFSDSSHLCFFVCPYCRKFDF